MRTRSQSNRRRYRSTVTVTNTTDSGQAKGSQLAQQAQQDRFRGVARTTGGTQSWEPTKKEKGDGQRVGDWVQAALIAVFGVSAATLAMKIANVVKNNPPKVGIPLITALLIGAGYRNQELIQQLLAKLYIAQQKKKQHAKKEKQD